MYLKVLSNDEKKKRIKHFSHHWPVSLNLKRALKEEDIKNFALIDVLEQVVAVKNYGAYTNKQIARIIKIIGDYDRKFMEPIDNSEYINTEICLDKGRLTEKPGNYLIFSDIVGLSDHLVFFKDLDVSKNKDRKIDRAFVIIYNTDKNHEREVLFLSKIILEDQLAEDSEYLSIKEGELADDSTGYVW